MELIESNTDHVIRWGWDSRSPFQILQKKSTCRVRRFRVLGSLWKRARSKEDNFVLLLSAAKYFLTPSELRDSSIQS